MDGSILRGSQVVIPDSLRGEVLKMLHKVPQGVVHSKALARSYVWWPGIDKDNESMISSCRACCENRSMPSKAPVIPWSVPQKPWSRLHLDFAGPTNVCTFFLLVDAYSKWIEVEETKGSMASSVVIACLTRWFSAHGIPDQIVTVTGPAFCSAEFCDFLRKNIISHVRVTPYNPSSNGQVERVVRTVKSCLKKLPPAHWRSELANILLTLRTTRSSSTNKTPSEMLMGRCVQTLFHKLHPAPRPAPASREQIAANSNSCHASRKFKLDDLVYFRRYGGSRRWVPGRILSIMGPRNVEIEAEDGGHERRHVDKLIHRAAHRSRDSANVLDGDDRWYNFHLSAASRGSPMTGVGDASCSTPVEPPQDLSYGTCEMRGLGQGMGQRPGRQLEGNVRVSSSVRKVPGYLEDYAL
ncbi:uncharacterized protein K02A2.6-like [Ischnura elegans]|uniref:uncharacterized protein K02A2.6-like n=1 Tax=Ischnura elegans TaxID=197161 RepID=UPI001ED8B963|nr:uncharacterized protein K02A2.6-like [Ischnura elegans]